MSDLYDWFHGLKIKFCFRLMLKFASYIGLNEIYCWTGGENSGKITVCMSSCKVSHSRAVEEMYENSLRM
jgi:hypothetical protein